MYGELKLAFIIYLWYPKTKVNHSKCQQIELNWFLKLFPKRAVFDNKDWFVCLWQGTCRIYEKLLQPFMTNHKTYLEKKLPEWRTKAWDLAIFYWQNCSDLGQSAIFQVLDYMAGQPGKHAKHGSKVKLCPLSIFSSLWRLFLLL